MGVGREQAKQTLREQPKIMSDLRAAILEAVEKREASEQPAIRAALPTPATEEEEELAPAGA
jgi:hypothetical protein